MEALSKMLVEWGVATRILSGQSESGDQYVVKLFSHGALLAVLDGLGHGGEAAAAARLACTVLMNHAHESVISLLRRCHDSLRGTRGVVMSLASLNQSEGTMTWLGVGNVQGLLMRSNDTLSPQNESLLLRGGVVGGQMPAPYASIIPIASGDTLVFFTDGIRAAGDLIKRPMLTGPPQAVADRILASGARRMDDALVLVARYRGGAE